MKRDAGTASRRNVLSEACAGAVACVYALVIVAPVVLRDGIPAYQHDWSWPIDSATVLSGAFNHLSTWDPAGLGSPNALASNNVLHLLIALPALILSGQAALKALVVAISCFAAYAMYFCARRTMYATKPAAVAASMFYLTLPVFANKFGAGHLAYLTSYAMQPLIFERASAYADAPQVRRLAQIALLIVLLTFQVQFAVFGLVVAVAGVARAGLQRIGMVLLASVAANLVALGPTVYAFFSSERYISALYLAPKLAWEAIFSSGFPDVLWMRRYVVPYSDIAMSGHFILTEVVITAAIFCAIFVRTPQRWGVIGMALVALFFTTGTVGPFGPFWRYAFTHWSMLTVFRDLYNANCLLALSYSLSLACIGRWRFAGPFALLVVTASGAPLLLGGLGKALPAVLVAEPQSTQDQVTALPPGRVASLPFDVPLRYRGHTPGGLDVMAPHDARHPSLSEYPTLFPLTAWSMTRCRCERWFSETLKRANVVGIVERPGFSSDDLARQGIPQPESDTWSVRPLGESQLVRSYSFAARQDLSFSSAVGGEALGIEAPSGPLPSQTSGPPQIIIPQPDMRIDDPRRAWVSIERWYAYSSDPLAAVPGGVTTIATEWLDFSVPPGQWSVLYASRRPLIVESGGRRRILPTTRGARWSTLISGGMIRFRSLGGRATVFRIARGSVTLPYGTYVRASVLSVQRLHPWKVRVVLDTTNGPTLLNFAERFSEGWTVRGSRLLWHGVGNGYANAFIIDRGARSLTIEYAPETTFLLLAIISSALELLIAFFALLPERNYAATFQRI